MINRNESTLNIFRDCRVVRDPQTLKSKGYGFVSFMKKVNLIKKHFCWKHVEKAWRTKHEKGQLNNKKTCKKHFSDKWMKELIFQVEAENAIALMNGQWLGRFLKRHLIYLFIFIVQISNASFHFMFPSILIPCSL